VCHCSWKQPRKSPFAAAHLPNEASTFQAPFNVPISLIMLIFAGFQALYEAQGLSAGRLFQIGLAKISLNCRKCGLRYLTGENETDRVVNAEISAAPGSLPSSRGVWAWLSVPRLGGSFRGRGSSPARHVLIQQPCITRGSQFAGSTLLSQRRIGGDASTVQKKERKYCH
jgi:hypothetical protein